MDKALRERTAAAGHRAHHLDWRKKMSDHVAYALLAYTALQIFVTMGALKTGHGSVLPYFALIVLLPLPPLEIVSEVGLAAIVKIGGTAVIIPACRYAEKRWEHLSDEEAADTSLTRPFYRDAGTLWACAIGLPFLVTYGYKLVTSLI